MILSFEKEIDLTAYEHNPEPKVVQQLSIAHEAFNGDITQYYINEDSFSEGDKASNAIGIPHKNPDNTIYYTYTDYERADPGILFVCFFNVVLFHIHILPVNF